MNAKQDIPRGMGLVITFCLLGATGCLHWPDAPILERVVALSADEHNVLVAQFPEAELAGAVYREHVENRWGKFDLLSTHFLFTAADEKLRYGTMVPSGSLNTQEAAFADALPEVVSQRLIRESGAALSGATLVGKPWRRVTDGVPVYQFEFQLGERSGLCSAKVDGTYQSIRLFQSPGR